MFLVMGLFSPSLRPDVCVCAGEVQAEQLHVTLSGSLHTLNRVSFIQS